ncbi:MAG: ATP-binding protein [Firmicutes bacterium]|nr:ATP-binding protein [Bacillota bacterium]
MVREAGTGKSTLIDILLAKLSSSRYKIIRIENPQNKPRKMYRGISSAMGVNTTWFGADALKVVDLLTYSYLESNRPSILVVDIVPMETGCKQPVYEKYKMELICMLCFLPVHSV